MLKRLGFELKSNPICSTEVDGLVPEDFFYYDKDGFELNLAERKFYLAQGYLLNDCLNHVCYQQPWFALEKEDLGLIIDHSIILHRCSYSGKAKEQLEKLKPQIPYADLLLKTKSKWGFDFALDAVLDGQVFEVIHIEYDSKDYDLFKSRLISVEYSIRHMDWVSAAKTVWDKKQEWQSLKGFEQNHWKANYLLGWNKSEYTEKTI